MYWIDCECSDDFCVKNYPFFQEHSPNKIQRNFHRMIPFFQQYLTVQQSAYIQSSSTEGATRSHHSKMSSKKGSTDIDSRTKFKTEVCKYWTNGIECPYGENCNFAHGKDQKRMKQTVPSKYKTRCCNRFQQDGYCPYGNRCQFIHCNHSIPRVEHRQALDQLRKDNEVFFAFLQERESIGAKYLRLPLFQSIGSSFQYENDNSIVDNQVDVRPRHGSF